MDTPQTPPDPQHMTKRERRLLRKQEKQEARERSGSRQSVKRWVLIAAVVILVGGGAWWLVNSGSGGKDTASEPDTDPFKGTETASVVVSEFSDFQCPACKAAQPVVKKVLETYGDRIRFEYNDYPLTTIHKNGQQAAEAGQCAFAQGKFWEYHDTLFDQQEAWSGKSGDDVRQAFLGYAKDLGLDEAAFTQCLADGAAKGSIASDVAAARSKGVNSTPTFFVNDEKLVGVPKEADFKAAIDKALGQG